MLKSIIATVVLTLPVCVFAGDSHPKGAATATVTATVTDKADKVTDKVADMADGEVKKVDKGAGKVTIKHGELKNLEMPPMTMVFRVKDAAMLDQLKAGDKIKFEAEKIGGAYTVKKFEVAK